MARDRVCFKCLEPKQVFWDQKVNNFICHNCFRSMHKKTTAQKIKSNENPTIHDLMEKWNKK